MKLKKKYSGIIVPAVTPLTGQFELDEEAIEKMFFHFYQYKISVFILGTTGESASLPLRIKKQYIKKTAQLKQGDDLLYAGISSNIVNDSVELAKFCFDHGVEAVEAGDQQKAFGVQELSNAYGNLYQSGRTLGESLWALKTLMSEKKLCQSYVMPPLHPQTFGEEQKLMDAFRQLDLSLKTKTA